MPIKKCTINGKSGYKWGDHGKCYVGEEGKKKAGEQAKAAYANGYTGKNYKGNVRNATSFDFPINK